VGSLRAEERRVPEDAKDGSEEEEEEDDDDDAAAADDDDDDVDEDDVDDDNDDDDDVDDDNDDDDDVDDDDDDDDDGDGNWVEPMMWLWERVERSISSPCSRSSLALSLFIFVGLAVSSPLPSPRSPPARFSVGRLGPSSPMHASPPPVATSPTSAAATAAPPEAIEC
jgi:hypothetical protein